jgi:hypothetical protein
MRKKNIKVKRINCQQGDADAKSTLDSYTCLAVVRPNDDDDGSNQFFFSQPNFASISEF